MLPTHSMMNDNSESIINMDIQSNIMKNPNRKIITEGSAEIVSDEQVFYNPVQEFNRDLSIAVLNVYFQLLNKENQEKYKQFNNDSNIENKTFLAGEKYKNGLRILEALSATGLRSIRYAKEVAGVREIIANDFSERAVESIRENIQHNGVEHLIEPSYGNAKTVMCLSTASGKRFDVVDLDPYGCPNPFLDAAVQCLTNGGLLLVTATDMAVLAGNIPEVCYAKYGSVPLRAKCCHELALRIVLNCIETHANRYGKYIKPLLSISADFYIRLFVRVYTSQAMCKYSISKQSMIYQCTGCETHTLQPLGIIKPNPTTSKPDQAKVGLPCGQAVGTNCEHCGHKHHMGGPIWSAPIHDTVFVQEVLSAVQNTSLQDLGTQRRIVGMLTMVLEELPDVPLYYTLDKLCNVLKLEIVPMMKFRSVLLHLGYRVSYSHAYRTSLKTDASAAVLWDILRSWNKRHPVKERHMIDGTPLKAILSVPCTQDYNFDELHTAANPSSRKRALSRFQENPAPHWGPGTRATIMIGDNKLLKRYRNQKKKQGQKTKTMSDDASAESGNESVDEASKCKQSKLQV